MSSTTWMRCARPTGSASPTSCGRGSRWRATASSAPATLGAGTIDFKEWYRSAFGQHSPWGDEDSPALVTEVETALERELSLLLMKGAKPRITKLKAGKALTEQGADGNELYLLLDGVLDVVV